MPRTASAVDPNDIRSHTFFMIEPQKTREFAILSGCVDCHTNGPGSPKPQAELERTFREIAPSYRETALVPAAQSSNRWTGFALANLGSRAVRLFFTLFDPDGRIFKSADVANPRAVTLEPGKQVASLVDEFFGGTLGGSQAWVRLSHYQPNLKGFYLEGDDAGTELTGLTVDQPPSQMWVTPVIWPGSASRVSLTNLSASDASAILVPMSATGSQAGTPLATAIAARGRRNFEVQALFPDLPQGGYVSVQSSVALQGQVTALQGKTLATLRLFPAGTGSSALTIPHVVLGDNWETRLILYNPMDHEVEVQIEMRRDGFTSLPYGGISRRTLPPGAMINESLAAFVPTSSSRVEGYLLVTASDPANRIQGAVSFGSLTGGAVAALSAESSGRKKMIFSHVAQGNGYWTGLALLARGGGFAVVELYSDQGILLQAREVSLNERRVATLGQLLPVGDVRGGYIQVRSSVDVFGFELFGNDRVSILAAVPPQ